MRSSRGSHALCFSPALSFFVFSHSIVLLSWGVGVGGIILGIGSFFRAQLPPTTFRYILYRYMPTRNRVVRSPFGGKRCIVDRLPLPPCCASGYCVAHLERPTGAACGRAPDEDLKMSALNMVFLQHDADGSGKTPPSMHPCTAASLLFDSLGLRYDLSLIHI